MKFVALIIGVTLLGGAIGWGIRRLSIKLALIEELEINLNRWLVWGPIVSCAILFGLSAWQLGFTPYLAIRLLWMALFVQIAFFDFEHRLILDWVSLPAMGVAILLSPLPGGPGMASSILGGLVAGGFFVAIYAFAYLVMKQEALGLGDVKLAFLLGFILGIGFPHFLVIPAIFNGVIIAALFAFMFMILRLKSRKDTFAYGPYLVLGAVVVMFQYRFI